MKYSKLFGQSRKVSKQFDSVNATLLIKGGFVDQVMAGVYNYLPLGMRVLTKIETIVREEMDKIGQEILMPSIVPFKMWEDTGRLETVDVLFKAVPANEVSKLKNDAEYILNSTQEDVVTPLAKSYISSYKDFPFALYQIQFKFRNEPRPKSGILRGREFRMKDLYSFHTSPDDLKVYYEKARDSYSTIFERLGFTDVYIAAASGGDFTEDFSHEFQIPCEAGEDIIFHAKSVNLSFNREVAPACAPKITPDEAMLPMEDVLGKGLIGVGALAKYLKIPVEKTTKTLIFEDEKREVIVAAVRGGYDINEEKLKKAAKVKQLKLATLETVRRVTGAEVGYAGILNLPKDVRLFVDESAMDRVNFETGANKTNYHTINANWGRDIPVPEKVYDIKVAKDGDLYPETGEKYEVFKASEVGNIFPLNTKFTKAIGYEYADADGTKKPIYMGSYGLGTTRAMGVLVEKFHDEKGIIWPKQIAPYQVHLIGLNGKGEEEYKKLLSAGIEVLFDDRDINAGEKFADADLIGIPIRLVVSDKSAGKVEWKERTSSESELLSFEDVLQKLK